MTLEERLAAMRAELDAASKRESFWALIGAEIAAFEADRVVLRIPLRRQWINLGGVVHGGSSAAFLDQAAGLAANATPEGRWVTAKGELSYRAPLPGDADHLICEARALEREGRTARVVASATAPGADRPGLEAAYVFVRIREPSNPGTT